MSETRIGCEVLGDRGERFRLTRHLGQGAFGAVYLAEGLNSPELVAVKMIPSGAPEDSANADALLNEIEIASGINHENVVRILHVQREDSILGPYLVMEYVGGGTLADTLRAARERDELLDLSKAKQIMLDIVSGASAINMRLLHRDIKPDNILFDGTQFKIADFGISRLIDARTRTRTFKGRQHVMYMAPEGWRGEANTEKIDVYSAGLVFYEILSLRHPIANLVADKDDWRAWERAHLFTPCPDIRSFRSEVPVRFAQVLLRMVAKRPQERPEWKEVSEILNSGTESRGRRLVDKAIHAALVRKQEAEKKVLAQQERGEEAYKQRELYEYSCERLVECFSAVVTDFNANYQSGSIIIDRGQRNTGCVFLLPGASSIKLHFFSPRNTRIRLRAGELMGGGYLGIEGGIGCNLVLLRHGGDDLYGAWSACSLKFSALVDPRAVASNLGMSVPKVEPFGLQGEQLFYEHIQWAAGGAHVFIYEFRSDMDTLFADYLELGFQQADERQGH